jgi:hypothetical protein
MGREVRRVPPTWQHPKDGRRYIPLSWDNLGRPSLGADQCMPTWPEAERTHLQMYETTSAGTPLSPPCASAKDLAKWLADHHADAGAGMTATEKEWLSMIESGKPAAPFAIEGGQVQPAFAKKPP